MIKSELNTSEILNISWAAPMMAMFDQNVVSIILQKSLASLERDRFVGGGLPFRKIGRLVRYVKQDILDWLQKSAPIICSTVQHSESQKRSEHVHEKSGGQMP